MKKLHDINIECINKHFISILSFDWNHDCRRTILAHHAYFKKLVNIFLCWPIVCKTPHDQNKWSILKSQGKHATYNTYIHTYIHIYIHIYVYVCTYVCIYICVCVCVYLSVHIYINIHIYVCMRHPWNNTNKVKLNWGLDNDDSSYWMISTISKLLAIKKMMLFEDPSLCIHWLKNMHYFIFF